MFKKNNTEVKSGDHFIELDKTNLIWEVIGIINNPHLPPHARIRKIGEDGIHLTSVSALLDNTFYKRLEHKSIEHEQKEKDQMVALKQQKTG